MEITQRNSITLNIDDDANGIIFCITISKIKPTRAYVEKEKKSASYQV
jgi:hypothetical protein